MDICHLLVNKNPKYTKNPIWQNTIFTSSSQLMLNLDEWWIYLFVVTTTYTCNSEYSIRFQSFQPEIQRKCICSVCGPAERNTFLVWDDSVYSFSFSRTWSYTGIRTRVTVRAGSRIILFWHSNEKVPFSRFRSNGYKPLLVSVWFSFRNIVYCHSVSNLCEKRELVWQLKTTVSVTVHS